MQIPVVHPEVKLLLRLYWQSWKDIIIIFVCRVMQDFLRLSVCICVCALLSSQCRRLWEIATALGQWAVNKIFTPNLHDDLQCDKKDEANQWEVSVIHIHNMSDKVMRLIHNSWCFIFVILPPWLKLISTPLFTY